MRRIRFTHTFPLPFKVGEVGVEWGKKTGGTKQKQKGWVCLFKNTFV
jgi:hypothetical protein